MNKKYLQHFDDIKAILNCNIEAEARNIAYHEVVARAINERFEGEPVTNRVVKVLQACLPAGASVACEGSAHRFLDDKIIIWNVPGHMTYETRLTFYLKCGEDFSIAKFDERNGSTGNAARKRNENRAALLVGTGTTPEGWFNTSRGLGPVHDAASAIDNFNRAKAQLDEALALLEDDNSEIRRALVDGAEGKDRR
jgi:hypothetical protein